MVLWLEGLFLPQAVPIIHNHLGEQGAHRERAKLPLAFDFLVMLPKVG